LIDHRLTSRVNPTSDSKHFADNLINPIMNDSMPFTESISPV